MLWVGLSLFSAFALASTDALVKNVLKRHDEYIVAWLWLFMSLPFLLPILFFIELPPLDRVFYIAFFSAMPLEALALILYTKALKASPLSLSLPFLSLTPVFLVGFSYLILGEKVSLMGGGGVFLIACGGYVLNFHHIGKGLLEPFRAIAREKGSLYMAIVAVIYSLTASLGKMAITHSSPLFFGVAYYIALSIVFAPVALWLRSKGAASPSAGEVAGSAKAMLIPGLINSLALVSHVLAMSMAQVAYMIALKRTSLLFGVLYGYFIFKEGNIRERFLGASLMFSGFVLVVFAG